MNKERPYCSRCEWFRDDYIKDRCAFQPTIVKHKIFRNENYIWTGKKIITVKDCKVIYKNHKVKNKNNKCLDFKLNSLTECIENK